jgi:hypothetical protein
MVCVVPKSAAPAPAPGPGIDSFTLKTTAATGAKEFSFGLWFDEGDVPSNFVLDIPRYQVYVATRHNDGSVKIAFASGDVDLTQNVAKVINISLGTPPTGTNLTASDIATANPGASIQFGSNGTISLSTLLASAPHLIWNQGHKMIHAIYRADLGGSTLLQGAFEVKLWSTGKGWVRPMAENGFLNNSANTAAASNADQSYVPTMIVNGATVYNNGGSSANHYKNAAYCGPEFYDAGGWVGSDPAVMISHSAKMRKVKLFPNYIGTGPSGTVLNALNTNYVPLTLGPLPSDMGGTGATNFIGILPLWDAAYLTSGDARALKATLVASSSVNSYGIRFREFNSKKFVKPSAFSSWNKNGPSGSGSETVGGAGTWEVNHHLSAGPTAYLITGDYWHYETMLAQASLCWLMPDNGSLGSGVNRELVRQTRGAAWMLRTVGQLCAFAPDTETAGGQIVADYRTLLDNNYGIHRATFESNVSRVYTGSMYQYEYGGGVLNGDGSLNGAAWGLVKSGSLYGAGSGVGSGATTTVVPLDSLASSGADAYVGARFIIGGTGTERIISAFDTSTKTATLSSALPSAPASGTSYMIVPYGTIALWMTDFWLGVNGYLWDVQPLAAANMSNLRQVRDAMYPWIVGRFGATGKVTEWPFVQAANYHAKVATLDDGATWYPTFADVYDKTFGFYPTTSTSNTLLGGHIDDADMGVSSYWGNLIPAVAYAAQHRAAGGLSAWARLTGATNWSAFAANFNDNPIWGISPRTVTPTALETAAQSLAPGQCRKLKTIAANVIVYNYPTTDNESFIKWASSAVYNAALYEIGFIGKMQGSDHAYHWFVYDEVANSETNTRAVWDPSNQSGHGFDHNACEPVSGTYYHRPYNATQVQKWVANTWSAMTAWSGGNTSIIGGLSWATGIGLLYNDSWNLRRWNGSAWSTLASPGIDSYHDIGEWNDICRNLVHGGGNASPLYRLNTDLTVTTLGTPPFSIGAAEGQGLYIADPSSAKAIAFRVQDGTFQEHDIRADTWSSLTRSTGSGASPQTGLPPLSISSDASTDHVIACPVPRYGVIVYIQEHGTGTAADMWVYKHS